MLALVAEASGAERIVWSLLSLRQTDGQSILAGDDRFTVVAFLGTECPLAKLYGPRLQRLADEFQEDGVRVLGVVSNIQDSPAEIDAYVRQHAIRFDVLKDVDQSIMTAFGATRTPEVFVVDAGGRIRYQGRIDDQYQPGVSRAEPTQHDLHDAITMLLNGQEVTTPSTMGVGCLITKIPDTQAKNTNAATVTFSRDIAPILNQHCVECHRPGEIGPMELIDYNEVVGWGQMILEVIDEGRMPPWHADPAVGNFVGARTLPSEARDMIAAWVEQGLLKGDLNDLPPSPQWTSGWHLDRQPDTTLAMRSRPFQVPAEGVVEYQYFVVDPKWTEDHWIRAAQVVPGNASVVHHAIVFVRPPDGSNLSGIGWLGAYVPGQRTGALPSGHARLVPAGSKLVFQMHYTPNGSEAEDITRVGIWNVDADQVTHEVITRMAINHEFEIPPEVKDYEVEMSVDAFPPNSRMLGITPHMHLRGKAFEVVAQKENNESEPLLRVPRYDFNWQHWYAFEKPIELQQVKSLDMKVVFDNSRKNPFNPNPKEYVSWGDQTWEEMAIAFFDVAIPKGGPRMRQHHAAAVNQAEKHRRSVKVQQQVEAFLAEMDTNGDGIVQREETPTTFQRFGFRQLDRNQDRQLDLDEITAAAEQRL